MQHVVPGPQESDHRCCRHSHRQCRGRGGPDRRDGWVVIPDRPAVAAADIRGGGPGTREIAARSIPPVWLRALMPWSCPAARCSAWMPPRASPRHWRRAVSASHSAVSRCPVPLCRRRSCSILPTAATRAGATTRPTAPSAGAAAEAGRRQLRCRQCRRRPWRACRQSQGRPWQRLCRRRRHHRRRPGGGQQFRRLRRPALRRPVGRCLRARQ